MATTRCTLVTLQYRAASDTDISLLSKHMFLVSVRDMQGLWELLIVVTEQSPVVVCANGGE